MRFGSLASASLAVRAALPQGPAWPGLLPDNAPLDRRPVPQIVSVLVSVHQRVPGLRRAMCRWCIATLILAVVGALIIYWRVNRLARTTVGHVIRQATVMSSPQFCGRIENAATAPRKIARTN
jgi:hypothetical protein